MQKIKYKESPSPHVVVENFMSIPAARKCLEEAQWLEPMYEPAKIGDLPELDGCETCEIISNTVELGTRHNDVVYLDGYYNKRREKSIILSQLEVALTNQSFLGTFKKLPGLFPIIAQTTHMETILSSYGMCDFYGWHKDTSNEFPHERVITCVVHWNTEPQQYTGGELILTGKTLEDQLAYTPVHNTAIFFESNKCIHAVNETQHEGEFKDNRFSINLWMGFATTRDFPHHKYR